MSKNGPCRGKGWRGGVRSYCVGMDFVNYPKCDTREMGKNADNYPKCVTREMGKIGRVSARRTGEAGKSC
jgi:hypothetical protein